MPVKDEIRTWLTELLEEINEHGKLSLVVLLHCSAQGGETELFPLKSTHAKWGDPASMAEMLYAVAARHARGIPGHQQFVIHAMFGEAVNLPARLLPFGLAGALTFGAVPGGLATEAPTAMGQTQQSMRLTEVIVQGAFAKDRHATETLVAANRDLTSRLDTAQNEVRELWLALRDVFSTLMELQKKAQLDVIAAKQRAVLVQEFTRLMPALLNGVTGRNIFPVAAGDTSLLRGVLKFADENTLKGLSALAEKEGPEAQAAYTVLVNRLNQLRKEEAEHDKKIEELAGEQIGTDYAAAAGDAAGRVIRVLRSVSDKKNGDGNGGSNGGSNGSNGHAPPKALVEKKPEPTLAHGDASTHADVDSHRAEVVDAPASNAVEAFGQAFIDAASASDIAALAGIMRAQGKGDVADKMEAAFKARSV